MGKRTAEVIVMVMVMVMAISIEVGLCSLDNTVFQALSPPPPESDGSSSTWLHGKYQRAYNQAELEPRDTARNLMESAENAAAKAKDTIASAARGLTDSVIRMVDSYDFHPDWPTEDQDEQMQNEPRRSSSTSYSKFDRYAARMANRAAETESDSEGDFTDHMIQGMDYGRSRLSNSYDHLKQNVNAGIETSRDRMHIDREHRIDHETMDRVPKTMESRERMHIDREHRIDHETMDRVPKTMESRARMNIDREHRIDHTCDFGDRVYGASRTSREYRADHGLDSGTQGKDESKVKVYGFGKERLGVGEKMKKAKEEL